METIKCSEWNLFLSFFPHRNNFRPVTMRQFRNRNSVYTEELSKDSVRSAMLAALASPHVLHINSEVLNSV